MSPNFLSHVKTSKWYIFGNRWGCRWIKLPFCVYQTFSETYITNIKNFIKFNFLKTKRIVPKLIYCLRYCFLLTKDCMHNEVWGCAETLPICLPGLWSSLNVWKVRIYQRVGIKPICTEYEKSVGKKREISAFGTLYGGQLPLSIELIKPYYLFIPLIGEASQFKLTPFKQWNDHMINFCIVKVFMVSSKTNTSWAKKI